MKLPFYIGFLLRFRDLFRYLQSKSQIMARYADLIPKRRIVSQRKLFAYLKHVYIKEFAKRC